MADTGRAERAARHLFELHRSGGRLTPLAADLHPGDLDEAYATQERLQDLLIPSRGGVAGYKIAITTPVMQRLMGLDHPIGGAIFSSLLHPSPARLRCADYGNVAVECEIAVRLAADLPAGQRYDRGSVAAAVGTVMAAIEIIDDQKADYKEANAFDLAANNAWNAGCVIGPEVAEWRGLDLAALGGRMLIAGVEVGRGVGGDVLGHPLTALAWLANLMAGRGRPLRRGMIVSTGSIVSTKWPKPGERVVAAIDGLGEAIADFV